MEISNNNSEQNIVVTERSKQFLSTASKWTKFYGIVICVVSCLGGLVSFIKPMGGAIDIISGLASIAMGVLAVIFLVQFSNSTKRALVSNDTHQLNNGLKNMYLYWLSNLVLTLFDIVLTLLPYICL